MLKNGLGAWAADVAEDSGDVCECARSSTSGRGEGGTDRGPTRGERERASVRGNDSASGEAGPQGREGRGAREQRELASTAWPHWAERGRE
jgi:hypothetical protein